MIKSLVLFFLVVLSVNILAEPLLPSPEENLTVNLFWRNLYNEGGWSLYCGLKFNVPWKSNDGRYLGVEHIYPVSWMLKSVNCNSRLECHNSGNEKFRNMESDLHNLYPVWRDLNNPLYDSEFGEIEGEEWRFDNCDFERRRGITEPRPLARGNIARAIFYMYSRYGMPINPVMFEVLKQWNRLDSPSGHELIRNDRIEKIQGNRNPYIDNPHLADYLAIQQASN